MPSTGVRTVALSIALSLSFSTAGATNADNTEISQEVAKQEGIYHRTGKQTLEGYTVDRSLASYADGLASEFDVALDALGPADRWLDIGAGEAQAILDYYTPPDGVPPEEARARASVKAQAVAMSIEDRRTPRWQQTEPRLGENQIRYLSDRRLREYSEGELGQFQLITDVIGGFSYSVNLSLFVEKTLGLLKVNGSFFTMLQDVRWEKGTNTPFYAGQSFLTEIESADGSEMKVCSWLKRVTCVEVTCESKPQWQPPMEAFRIRKICSDVKVPALKATHYEAGTPPERRYRLQD
jgi:hypothetical protein